MGTRRTITSVATAAATALALLVPGTAASAAGATIVVDADGRATATSCDATATAPKTVAAGLAASSAGDTVLLCPGTTVETSQVVVAHDVTVRSVDPLNPTVVTAGYDTASSGDARGWWLVRAGAHLQLRDLVLSAAGRKVHQGVRVRGTASVRDIEVRDLGYNPSGPDRSGIAIVAFGDGPVEVTGSTFRRIGRVGALFFGAATSGSSFRDNDYVGKGPGDHLDYGVELGSGAQVTVADNRVTDARGRAEGAVSAGVLISTAFGGGAGGAITGNTFTRNVDGVFVDDGSGNGLGALTIARNALSGNDELGVSAVGSVVDATCNWWGATDGPSSVGGSGAAAAPDVEVIPFLVSPDLGGRCSTTPQVVLDTTVVTTDEGQQVVVTGSYQAGTPEAVAIAATLGSTAKLGTNVGTFTLTTPVLDGPRDSTRVTVTGDNGEVGSAELALTVTNVAPSGRFDAPSTAFTDTAFTIALRSATDPSPADRAAGLSFAFDCGSGAGFGAFSSSSTTSCTAARGGRRTVRALVRDVDGGNREYVRVVEVTSPDGDGAPDRSASGTVGPGGEVSTGTGAATPSDPVTTTVVTPSGGDVTIEEGPPGTVAPEQHRHLVWASSVIAPRETVDRPLAITFRIDADLLPPDIPGTGLPNVVPVRDGVAVAPCTGDGATPDPCLSSSYRLGDDLVLVVRTTRAGSFSFAEPLVACPSVGTARAPFTDVDGNVHRDAIDCAVRWGLVNGATATTYAPARVISRGQVASIVSQLLTLSGVALPQSPPDAFTDDDGTVFEAAIDEVASIGVMKGTSATTFSPARPLTRAQLASILAAAYEVMLGEPLADGPDAFADDDGSVHEANIDATAAAGLVQGRDDTRFEPSWSVNRAQGASFLTRLLDVWYVAFRS